MTAPSRSDLNVLNTYLRHEARPALLRDGGLLLAAALIWLWLCWQGLSQLLGLRYAFLTQFSPSAQDMAIRVGPYLWWTLAALLSLGVLALLRRWADSRIQRHWAQVVAPGALAPLYRQLSSDGRRVLAWVWQDRDEPLVLGDIKRTATELANGRVEKFYLAQEQAQALSRANQPEASQVPAQREPTPRAPEPVIMADREADTPAASPFNKAKTRQEPRLDLE